MITLSSKQNKDSDTGIDDVSYRKGLTSKSRSSQISILLGGTILCPFWFACFLSLVRGNESRLRTRRVERRVYKIMRPTI